MQAGREVGASSNSCKGRLAESVFEGLYDRALKVVREADCILGGDKFTQNGFRYASIAVFDGVAKRSVFFSIPFGTPDEGATGDAERLVWDVVSATRNAK